MLPYIQIYPSRDVKCSKYSKKKKKKKTSFQGCLWCRVGNVSSHPCSDSMSLRTSFARWSVSGSSLGPPRCPSDTICSSAVRQAGYMTSKSSRRDGFSLLITSPYLFASCCSIQLPFRLIPSPWGQETMSCLHLEAVERETWPINTRLFLQETTSELFSANTLQVSHMNDIPVGKRRDFDVVVDRWFTFQTCTRLPKNSSTTSTHRKLSHSYRAW